MAEIVAANAVANNAVGLPVAIRLRQEAARAVGTVLQRHAIVTAATAL